MSVSDQLRAAIRESGLSHNEIARQTEVAQPIISRFVSGGRDLKLATVDVLAEFFGMHLTRPRKVQAD